MVIHIWTVVKALFTFKPPATPLADGLGHEVPADSGLQSAYPFSLNRLTAPHQESIREKIWIDNIFRVWVSILTFLICVYLNFAGAIENFIPFVFVLAIYGVFQIGFNILLFKTSFRRHSEFLLCSVDIMAISVGVLLTGGISSPVYFLYFIPFITNSFHRDWTLLLYNGLGGIIGYGSVLFFFYEPGAGHSLATMGARLLFMLITVGAALLAINLMRKQEHRQDRRRERMRILLLISQTLNGVTSEKDLPDIIRGFVALLNNECCRELNAWARIFLLDESGQNLIAHMDPEHLHWEYKQEMPASACRAFAGNRLLYTRNSDQESLCQTEKLSFLSHICAPISGTGNETFGVIYIGSALLSAFGEEEVEFLQSFGLALGLTIQRLKRFDELQLSLEMDSCAMATYMASLRGEDETEKICLEGLKAIFKADQTTLLLWDPSVMKLTVKQSVNGPGCPEADLAFHRGEGVVGRVFDDVNPSCTSDIENDAQFRGRTLTFKTLLCLPMRNIKGEPIGVINVWYRDNRRKVSAMEIDTGLTFLSRAAVALENALLHKKTRDKENGLNEAKAA